MMKKNGLYTIVVCLFLTVCANHVKASDSTTVAVQTEEARKLVDRLTEIKEMDKSNLNRIEKKQLKTEIIDIEKRLKTMDGGVYISVGGIIIILLLLIIIF